MGMHNGQYYLSNSEMNDWETMCPIVWKALHIDKTLKTEPSEAMMYGQWFETLAIGSGVGGQVCQPTPKMLKSAYAERIEAQAQSCQAYLKAIGGEKVSYQEYIYTTIIDANGQVIPVCGGLDIRWKFTGDVPRYKIIDLKMTGDSDNDFGDYQFGNPDKINPQQAIHYKILHRAKYSEDAEFSYWVFDKSPSQKQKIIDVNVSEMAEAIHIEKCSRIYNEIAFALEMDDWEHKNTFENCRECPIKCKFERIMPEAVEITV